MISTKDLARLNIDFNIFKEFTSILTHNKYTFHGLKEFSKKEEILNFNYSLSTLSFSDCIYVVIGTERKLYTLRFTVVKFPAYLEPITIILKDIRNSWHFFNYLCCFSPNPIFKSSMKHFLRSYLVTDRLLYL